MASAVVRGAIPPEIVAVPRAFVPSRNWTVPGAELGEAVAVAVVGCPYGLGFCAGARATVVQWACAESVAVSEWFPRVVSETENWTLAVVRAAVPRTVTPSRSWTEPVGWLL